MHNGYPYGVKVWSIAGIAQNIALDWKFGGKIKTLMTFSDKSVNIFNSRTIINCNKTFVIIELYGLEFYFFCGANKIIKCLSRA